jgi:Spy/CpxP family protein refolding chaperone
METTKTRSEAAILVVVVFVLGALFGGTANHLWGERVWGKQAPPPPRTTQQIVTDMTAELNLTPAQAQQFGAIVDDTHGQIHADYDAADARRDQIRKAGRDRLRAILTPEQLPKFEEIMRKLDEQRKQSVANPH